MGLILERLGPLSNRPRVRQLAEDLAASNMQGKAISTWRQYRPAWEKFKQFCQKERVDPYNCGGMFVACYLHGVRKSAEARGVGHQAVDRASAAISAFYEAIGKPTPCLDPFCTVVRTGASRSLITNRRARPEVTAQEVDQLLQHHLPPNGPKPTLETRMFVTCILLCFVGLMRYDDLARVMVHPDLMRIQPGEYVELYLWRSKTDQVAEGDTVVIGTTGGPHCPVGLLQELLTGGEYLRHPRQGRVNGKWGDLDDVGPLLRAVVSATGGGQQLAQTSTPLPDFIPALPYNTFSDAVERLFSEAGVTRALGTHAFRRGGASTAVNNGADRTLVQKHGRWRSAKVFEKRYVKESAKTKKKLTHLILTHH